MLRISRSGSSSKARSRVSPDEGWCPSACRGRTLTSCRCVESGRRLPGRIHWPITPEITPSKCRHLSCDSFMCQPLVSILYYYGIELRPSLDALRIREGGRRKRLRISLHELPNTHRRLTGQPFDIVAEPIIPIIPM